ncbi:MAG TPA: hypothetical protein VGJ73_07530 [Verrucomicrobiae bacterium]
MRKPVWPGITDAKNHPGIILLKGMKKELSGRALRYGALWFAQFIPYLREMFVGARDDA